MVTELLVQLRGLKLKQKYRIERYRSHFDRRLVPEAANLKCSFFKFDHKHLYCIWMHDVISHKNWWWRAFWTRVNVGIWTSLRCNSLLGQAACLYTGIQFTAYHCKKAWLPIASYNYPKTQMISKCLLWQIFPFTYLFKVSNQTIQWKQR